MELNLNVPTECRDYKDTQCHCAMRFLLAAVLFLACLAARADDLQYDAKLSVYFSPKGGCTEAVVRELAGAKRTVLVQAYSFTNAPIAKALVDAHKRGVTLSAVLDKSQRTEKYTSATFVANAGIAVSQAWRGWSARVVRFDWRKHGRTAANGRCSNPIRGPGSL